MINSVCYNLFHYSLFLDKKLSRALFTESVGAPLGPLPLAKLNAGRCKHELGFFVAVVMVLRKALFSRI